MNLLVEIHKLTKTTTLPKVHDRNFVAKHMRSAGAGVHRDKQGEHASRSRQKQAWKKEMHND